MDKLDNLEKLKEKFNISYEQAKIALELNDWDMLDAVLYLENNNIIEKPEEGIFFTNTMKSKYTEGDSISNNLVKVDVKENRDNTFFENICDLIDKANNIIFEIIKIVAEIYPDLEVENVKVTAEELKNYLNSLGIEDTRYYIFSFYFKNGT